jgi:hypothetical protein
MARTTDLLALIWADRRRLAAWLAGGWTVFALVMLLALTDLGCRGCPPGTVARFTTIKVLLFCLVYSMSPWAFSVHVVHLGTDILAGLPLSCRDINRFLLLRGLVLGLACLPVWGLILWVLPRFGFAIHPWLLGSVGLGLLAYQLFGMVTGTFVRVAVAAIFPFLVFPPHTHQLLRRPLEFAATPWAVVLMAVLIMLALPRVMSRPLPRAGRRN